MRELEFRAWVENQCTGMAYMNYKIEFTGGLINDIFATSGVQPVNELHNKITYLQYTGLKDKNGKKVFEGDILIGRNRRTDWKERNEKVTFLNGCYMFGKWNAHEYFNGHAEIEVIGNIFENPDLLEG